MARWRFPIAHHYEGSLRVSPLSLIGNLPALYRQRIIQVVGVDDSPDQRQRLV